MHQVSVSSGDLHPQDSWFGGQPAVCASCRGSRTEVSGTALVPCKDRSRKSLVWWPLTEANKVSLTDIQCVMVNVHLIYSVKRQHFKKSCT